MSNYYIMNAGSLFDNKAVSVERIIEEWADDKKQGHCHTWTILVGTREYGYGKYAKVFVVGAGDGYESVPDESTPHKRTYTQDKGNCYAHHNKEFVVDNVITIHNDKVVDAGNGIGRFEKRRVWVMK